MTLKKGFILEKNHTHVKVGHTSEFLFGIYWWTLKNLKNQNFEKNEKDLLGDIMILHMCTKSHNHIKYSSCDTELDRIFLSFWAISQLEILSFYTCVPQMMIIWCMVPEILSTTDRTFCHFELFFALLSPNNQENQNFEKMKKNSWRYYHF